MNYRLAYAVGFHPWEELAEHPPFAGKFLGARTRLLERELDTQRGSLSRRAGDQHGAAERLDAVDKPG